METPEQKEIRARKLEAEALKLRTDAEKEREKKQAISPRTKLPVEHPESQAVERAHYEMQTSLCGRKPTAEELAELKRNKKE